MGQFLILLGVFLTSFFIAYGITVGRGAVRRRQVHHLAPTPDALIRIRCREGVLRCNMVNSGRDSCPVLGGVLLFSTRVLGRDASNHQLEVAVPDDLRRVERRVEPRDCRFRDEKSSLNGEMAVLLDVSPNGARVISTSNACAGDSVTLQLPGELGLVRGLVLSTLPDSLGSKRASQIRVLFVDSIEADLIEAVGNRFGNK